MGFYRVRFSRLGKWISSWLRACFQPGVPVPRFPPRLLVMFRAARRSSFRAGLVGGEMPPGFGDFPELIVDAFHDVGCVDDLAKLRREP